MPDDSTLVKGSSLVLNGVTAYILAEGFGKSIEQGIGPTREITYQVPWDDSDKFMDSLIGTGSTSGGPTGSRIYPVFHAYPGNSALLCRRCEAVGIGYAKPDDVAGKLIATDAWAHVRATYQRPVFDYYGNDTANAFGGQARPFAEYRVRSYTDSVSAPRGRLKYEGDGGDPINDDPVVSPTRLKVPVKEYNYVLHYLNFLPELVLDPLMGTLNAATFWGKEPGTIQFLEWDADNQIDANGDLNRRIEMRFLWRIEDWNKVPRSDTIGWIFAKDDDGDTEYEYKDWSGLLAL